MCFNLLATITPAIGLECLIVLQSAFDGCESGKQIAALLQIQIEFGNCKVLGFLLEVDNS